MEYIDILNKVGLKVTKSRSVVLSIFENADRILNVSEIYDVCRDRGFAINLSTIYRTCEKGYWIRLLVMIEWVDIGFL